MAETAPSNDRSNERLVLVDEEDNVLGYETRGRCHHGDGLLHRGFSVYLFDERRKLLIQKRSARKDLWPGYWSNSCCSHPRPGESYEDAARRRVREELGLVLPLKFLFRFRYQARYDSTGSENELCSVFVGEYRDSPEIDPEEIEAWKCLDVKGIDVGMKEAPALYTPWFKLAWESVRRAHP